MCYLNTQRHSLSLLNDITHNAHLLFFVCGAYQRGNQEGGLVLKKKYIIQSPGILKEVQNSLVNSYLLRSTTSPHFMAFSSSNSSSITAQIRSVVSVGYGSTPPGQSVNLARVNCKPSYLYRTQSTL